MTKLVEAGDPLGDPVLELERRILPLLEVAATSLRVEFPDFGIRTESHSVGSQTNLKGHSVALGCVLVRTPDFSRDEPDLIDLVVGVRHLASGPQLAQLYVCWGHPSGCIELELLRSPIPADESAWKLAEESVPALLNAFRTAILRGQPPDGSPNAFPY
jgi:hypothetical protein